MQNKSKQIKEKNYLNFKSLVLGTVCLMFFNSNLAKAELSGFWGGGGFDSSGSFLKKGTSGSNTLYLAETRAENTFTAKQTFGSITFSTTGSATVNTIANVISSSSTNSQLVTAKAVYDALDNAGISDMSIYAKTADVYTQTQADGKFATIDSLGDYVLSDDLNTTLGGYVTTGSLTTTLNGYATTDSVYNKTDADGKFATKASLESYAKSSDVASTYATKTALNEGLGGKVDTSAFNEYKTTVSDTYATKASLNDYVTNDSLGTTLGSYVTSDSLNTTLGGYVTSSSLNTTLGGYAKTTDVYTKDEADTVLSSLQSSINSKVNADDVYTKAQADVVLDALQTDISGKANVSDVYTKTDADNKFALKDASYTKDEADSKFLTSADMSGYAKSDDIAQTYATKNELGDYAKTSDIAQTYATKNDLNGYVTSSALDTTLSGYVTSNSLDSTLSDYAKTSDLNAYVTSTALETTLGDYAKSDEVYSKTEMNTKLQDYVTSDSLNTTLSDYVTSDSLTSTLGDYATKDNVYTKTEIDNTFVKSDDLNNTLADYVTSSSLDTKLQDYATATELSGLSDTVSGLSSDVNTLQTSVNNKADKADLTALQTTVDGKVNQSDFNDYKTSNDNAVANALSQIANKQDALTSEQMAVLNSGITASDVQTVKDVTDTINTMSHAVTDLSTDFGDVADFKNSTTGNIKNADPSSTTPNATTVTKAIANIDASIGQVHGLADKLKKAGKYKGNLAEGTTVEEHLAVIDTVIGDRSQFATGRYTASSAYVADAVVALDNGLSNLADDFAAAQGANEARFRNLDRRINKLDDKISKGIAGSNALAALKPLDSSYRSQLAVALGGFDGDQAVAFGAFHYINNRTMINAGISYSGRNYNSYNVGIVFGF